MQRLTEPSREIPVVEEADVCVIGGSCTGLFAAVRAARLGARVALVEKTNAFGGVATNGLVNVWHSIHDDAFDRQIVGGLSVEVMEALHRRDACIVEERRQDRYRFNSAELMLELDRLMQDAGSIRTFFHTFYAGAVVDGGRIEAIVIENKNGRQAIRAAVYIDASGDGDLAAHCRLPFALETSELQPPTTCALIQGLEHTDVKELYRNHHEEYGLATDSGWHGRIPVSEAIRMFAENHIFGCNAADADDLTVAELAGRRHIHALLDMARKYGDLPAPPVLLALPACIGIRETRRFRTDYVVTEEDLLSGRRFPDAVANGTYPLDVHNPSGGGFQFKYLNGSTFASDATGQRRGRWRPESADNPLFYQVPYRSMVHRTVDNLILAGRMIGCDRVAFGGVRVMINLNQVGEAAGVAAVLALRAETPTSAVDPAALRKELANGGSVVI